MGGDHERAHMEGPQPGRAVEAAFGKYHERLPGLDEGDEPFGVGHAVLALVAFDELNTEPLERESDQRLTL